MQRGGGWSVVEHNALAFMYANRLAVCSCSTTFAQPPRPHNPPFAHPLEGEIPFAQPFALF